MENQQKYFRIFILAVFIILLILGNRMRVNYKKDSGAPQINQEDSLIGDYNFDGNMDLAVRSGNNGGYGSPSYDIYLFDPATKKLIKSDEFTRLASQNLGMFTVDSSKKILTTEAKSGCCWHQTDQYEVVNNKPKLVRSHTEDGPKGNGKITITEQILINEKWVTTSKEVGFKF